MIKQTIVLFQSVLVSHALHLQLYYLLILKMSSLFSDETQEEDSDIEFVDGPPLVVSHIR